MKVDMYYKAIVGGLVAGLAALGGMLVGDAAISDITAGQWVTVALAFLTGLGVVYGVPNAPREPSQEPIWVGTEAEVPYGSLSTWTSADVSDKGPSA